MVRPCVARGFVELAFSGLASMYPVSDWSCFAPDQYGYQRACDLISGQASLGHSGHQCSHAPGRPILHLFSFSRRPRRVRVLITSSIASWVCAVLCSCLAAVPSSRPAGAEVRRAQGPSRLAVALALPLAPALPGHALTGPSTARGLSGSRRSFIGLDALEGAPLVKNRPGDAGELVGERNRQHVVVEALLCGLDPRLEPIAVPMLRPDLDQHDPGGLNEQSAQIAIAALRYAAEDRAVAGR